MERKEKEGWKRKFILTASGQAVSMLGSHGVQFALIWWLAEKTSSPLMLGISGIAAYIPMTLLSPLAGIAADRLNRKFISIFSDMAMGTAALIYSILLYTFELPVWTVLIMLCARGIGSTFQQPAIQSIIPQLVPADRLLRTNGWMQLLNAGSFLLGPVIGALLYGLFPIHVVLISDIIGALFASLALAAVKVPPLEKKKREKQNPVREYREGLEIFKRDRRLLLLTGAEAMAMFFYGPLSSFYPLMTSDYFNLPAIYGSGVELAFALGMIGASLVFSSVVRVKDKLRVSMGGLVAIGIISSLCGLIPASWGGWFVFAFLCACLGAASNTHSIPLTAYVQETVEKEKMGRAFSLLTLISSAAMPAGLLLSSPLAELTGVRSWFLIAGLAITAITGGVSLMGRRNQ
ncbi:MAG TPA: MFS transporter [Candidatus Copromorpha excrementigallinarum]|uniref:MFS transporter n=1 Tax=Candidatus Allocopromorpha excrementigallinarum TaxID=2840742 RepID=A0A9D1I1R2_9FIRM|nr:MFS transporter [Candidatus Copromorpha excrementigallinarum]